MEKFIGKYPESVMLIVAVIITPLVYSLSSVIPVGLILLITPVLFWFGGYCAKCEIKYENEEGNNA